MHKILKKTNKINTILRKLYEGEYSLSKSYWLFGNVVPFLLFALMLGIIFGFSSSNPLTKLRMLDFKPEGYVALMATIFLSIITLIYIFISTVGVWRSATKHSGRKLWAILAKITIVIAFISYANDLRKFIF